MNNQTITYHDALTEVRKECERAKGIMPDTAYTEWVSWKMNMIPHDANERQRWNEQRIEKRIVSTSTDMKRCDAFLPPDDKQRVSKLDAMKRAEDMRRLATLDAIRADDDKRRLSKVDALRREEAHRKHEEAHNRFLQRSGKHIHTLKAYRASDTPSD